ncbi:hypothetical protein Poli38472_012480 [Pythium oligandrum]|uniref:Late endosomal/lysosomal adaptor and MAPK and MTOR activator 5 n=1 Tax=Pythium oligandrum TaxID=41045 RepID=A0A8K1FNI5_PYTOL|nr:hypothetical protein Poli38472_012480 [Pythium oligandrum]|eukprot:TMW67364.1 hypothetical protein Poli38472_012480 [Pythium oligandrum]
MAEGMQGVLVNDAQGLCVKADGDLKSASEVAGFFTSIVESATNLGEGEEGEVPTVRIETSLRTLLVSRVMSDNGERTIVVSKASEEASGE